MSSGEGGVDGDPASPCEDDECTGRGSSVLTQCDVVEGSEERWECVKGSVITGFTRGSAGAMRIRCCAI